MLSFLRFGIDAKDPNNLLGLTRIESVLKLLEERFNSSKVVKKFKFVGNVQKSLDAISKHLSFYKQANSCK